MLLLSPIDHVFVGPGSYVIEFAFHYPGGLDGGRLASSLARALELHWPLGCTLRAHGDRYAFVPGAQPVALEEESLDGTLSLAAPEQLDRFLPGVRSLPGEPLCRVKLTHGANGSVLGASISHALVDGFSFFMFLYNWAQATRGLDLMPVSHARELLLVTDGPRALLSSRPDLERQIGFAWSGPRGEVQRSQVQSQVLRYSKDDVAQLAAEGKHAPVKLSINDLLGADLWKRLAEHAWPAERELAFATPVDVRRLVDRVPANYMGNAVMLSHTQLPADEVRRLPVRALAERLRASLTAATPERFDRTLAALEALRAQHGLGALSEVHVADPRHGFLLTNLSRLPALALDFGSGAPASLVPGSRFAGTASVLAAPDGGLDVHVSLPASAAAQRAA